VSPSPGADVRCVMGKWGGRPHWEFDAVLLGSDEHGDWLGIEAGTLMVRPGAEYVAPVAQVGLSPAPGPDEDRGWLATFHARGGQVQVYVDMTTPPVWEGRTLTAVDLDLDVVRGNSGRVWVDDEDEFADHRVRFGYPDEVARLAMDSCDRVRAAMLAGAAPYDGVTHLPWLERLAAR
jgi:uncharacterized protein